MIDSYYARDILELFNVRNRIGFLKLMNLLLCKVEVYWRLLHWQKKVG